MHEFIIKNVNDEEILDRLEPIIKEYFSNFLLVGFHADTGKVGCIGEIGKVGSQSRRRLKRVHSEIQMMINIENEKNP